MKQAAVSVSDECAPVRSLAWQAIFTVESGGSSVARFVSYLMCAAEVMVVQIRVWRDTYEPPVVSACLQCQCGLGIICSREKRCIATRSW